MATSYRLLLIESDDYSGEVLEKFIRRDFPYVEVECSPPEAALATLDGNDYHLLICDAFLRHHDKISFVGTLCRESGLALIVITGDTTIRPDTFSPHVEERCIHHILYKPLDLNALGGALQCAIQGLKRKKADSK